MFSATVQGLRETRHKQVLALYNMDSNSSKLQRGAHSTTVEPQQRSLRKMSDHRVLLGLGQLNIQRQRSTVAGSGCRL